MVAGMKLGTVITISSLEATASLMQVRMPSATNAGSLPASIAVSIIAGAATVLVAGPMDG